MAFRRTGNYVGSTLPRRPSMEPSSPAGVHGPFRLLWCQRLLIRLRPAPGLDWVKDEYR